MKLVRYGARGKERPALRDAAGTLRDLSGVVPDITGATLNSIESIVLGDGGPRHTDTLKALIDAGAKLDLADREGRTPLALARGRGYRQMVTLLEQGRR